MQERWIVTTEYVEIDDDARNAYTIEVELFDSFHQAMEQYEKHKIFKERSTGPQHLYRTVNAVMLSKEIDTTGDF